IDAGHADDRRAVRVGVLERLDARLHVHVVGRLLAIAVGPVLVLRTVLVLVARRLTGVGPATVAVGRLLGAGRRVVLVHVVVLGLALGAGVLFRILARQVVGVAPLEDRGLLRGGAEADAVGACPERSVGQALRVGGTRCVAPVLGRQRKVDGAAVR